MTPLSNPGATLTYTILAPATVNPANAAGWVNWDLSATLPSTVKYVEVTCEYLSGNGALGVRNEGSSVNRTVAAVAGLGYTLLTDVGTSRIIEGYSPGTYGARYHAVGYWQ